MFNPVSGSASPIAPPLRFEFEGTDVVGLVTLGPAHEGHVGLVHGGIIALLLDEVLGVAAVRRVWPSITSRLVVRYRRPVPVDIPLVVRATVVAVNGRRMTLHGTVSTKDHPDTVLVDGEAWLVELDQAKAVAILGSALRVGARPVA